PPLRAEVRAHELSATTAQLRTTRSHRQIDLTVSRPEATRQGGVSERLVHDYSLDIFLSFVKSIRLQAPLILVRPRQPGLVRPRQPGLFRHSDRHSERSTPCPRKRPSV